jgi:hypothetical protein
MDVPTGYTKVKWLKSHHKYAYVAGSTGIVKTNELSNLKDFVEVVEEAKSKPKATKPKTTRKRK